MRSHIALALRGLSEIYDKEITQELLEIWCRVLEDLTPEELAKAVTKYVKDNSPFFPKPGQIYSLARPEPDKEEEASIITDSIFNALSSYGIDQLGTHRAKLKIGEVGWAYIELQGGWSGFQSKNNTDVSDLSILKAQCRRSIMGLLQRLKDDKPILPGRENVTLDYFGVKIKTLE